jgi:hypothetical protein
LAPSTPSTPTTAWSGPLSIGLGFACAYISLLGWPVGSWLGGDVNQRLFLLSLGLTATGLWQAGAQKSPPILLALVAALATWHVLGVRRDVLWHSAVAWAWLAALALALLLLLSTSEALARARPGAAWTGGLAASSALLALSIQFAHSSSLAQLASALAAALGVATLVALRCPRFSLAHGAATAAVTLHAALVAAAYYFASDELSPAAALLLAIAPATAWLSALAPEGRARSLATALPPVLASAVAAALVYEPGAALPY